MNSDYVARDLIHKVLDRGVKSGPTRGGSKRQRRVQEVQAVQQSSQNGAVYGYVQAPGGLPVYTAQQSGVMPPPLYTQDFPAPTATRGVQVQEHLPSRGGDTDYVNEAFTDALSRARTKWNFNLMISLIIAGLIILGVTITGIWMMLGEANALTALFGTGATVLGILSWALARPASQLNDADNQVSLLMMIWTKYTQDLQACERITDPSSAASCMSKVGDDAISHFNEIVGKQANS